MSLNLKQDITKKPRNRGTSSGGQVMTIQGPVFNFIAIFFFKFRDTAKLQNGQFRGNFAVGNFEVKMANFATVSRLKGQI
jgi:hypothetical protein